MDSKLVLLVLAAFVCAASARSHRSKRSLEETPDVIGTILGKEHKEESVQIIEDDGEEIDAEEPQKPEVLPEVPEKEVKEKDSSEEVGSGESDADYQPGVCSDISGVFTSSKSTARLVIMQSPDGRTIQGMFQKTSPDGAWRQFMGFRGNEGQFGIVGVQGTGIAAVTGLCKPCDGSLDLHLISAFPKPGCKSTVVPMFNNHFLRAGSAMDALHFIAAYQQVENAAPEFGGVEDGSGYVDEV